MNQEELNGLKSIEQGIYNAKKGIIVSEYDNVFYRIVDYCVQDYQRVYLPVNQEDLKDMSYEEIDDIQVYEENDLDLVKIALIKKDDGKSYILVYTNLSLIDKNIFSGVIQIDLSSVIETILNMETANGIVFNLEENDDCFLVYREELEDILGFASDLRKEIESTLIGISTSSDPEIIKDCKEVICFETGNEKTEKKYIPMWQTIPFDMAHINGEKLEKDDISLIRELVNDFRKVNSNELCIIDSNFLANKNEEYINTFIETILGCYRNDNEYVFFAEDKDLARSIQIIIEKNITTQNMKYSTNLNNKYD